MEKMFCKYKLSLGSSWHANYFGGVIKISEGIVQQLYWGFIKSIINAIIVLFKTVQYFYLSHYLLEVSNKHENNKKKKPTFIKYGFDTVNQTKW